MDRKRFEQLVAQAVESLPGEFLEQMENIDVVVEDEPTLTQLRRSRMRRGETLLGLYEGVPQTHRTTYYSLVPPDKITIFQKPIEAICRNDDEVKAEVQRVARHEIAHHFGIGDVRLRQLEKRHKKR